MLRRSFILILLLALLLISCDVTGNNTLSKTRIPQLRLVSVGSNVFNKANVSTGADIDFGDVLATKKLYYLIENSGEIPVFNVQLSTSKDSIEISPSSIGAINPEGSVISTTPLISIICPHVIPSSGVGAYLPLSAGELSDYLFIDYQFIAPFDSINTWSEGDTINATTTAYSITGNKKGVVLNFDINDTPAWDYHDVDGVYWNSINYDLYIRFIQNSNTNNDTLNNLLIHNTGNCPIKYQTTCWSNIYNDYIDRTRDTVYYSEKTLLASETLSFNDLKYFINDYPPITDTTRYAYYYCLITFGPTPNVIGVGDEVYTDGYFVFKTWVRFDYDE